MKHTSNALDKKSYHWLQENDPDLAEAIEADVADGSTPTQLYRLVLRQRDSRKLALLCEASARWLVSKAEPVSALERYGVKE